MYLRRAPTTTAPTVPDPWIAVVLTVAAPVLAMLIGYRLLGALNIDAGSTAYSAPTYSLVRTAITQALDRDLASDRIQEVLTRTTDPAPGTDKETKSARTSVRTGSLKAISGRLAADRSRLVDTLTLLAMNPHPSRTEAVRNGTKPADVVRQRLTDDAVRDRTRVWVTSALDPHTKHLARDAVEKADTSIPDAIANSLALDALRLNVDTAVSPRLDPFDARASESGWAKDVGARIAWGVIALMFCMTFALVLFTSSAQILRIGSPTRWEFAVVAAVGAVIAGVLVHSLFDPAVSPTPLHRALNEYAELFGVRILTWASVFNVLRAVGVVLLIAGSVATFSVEVKDIKELEEQLRGFKALFNAGTVFLLAGVLEVYALFRWPVIFAPDEPTRTALQGAAATFAAAIGGWFTVVLLSAYVATTVVLRQQAVARTGDPDEVDKALSKFGFGDLTSQQGMRLAQALLPLVPGFINVLT